VTGNEALAVAREFDPELCILDIGLPDLSGFEVARALRARETQHPLYLAAVTGWGDRETRENAFRAGFDEHVVKPTDSPKLQQIVKSATQALG
jgi:CheY-like chemotaxis protein